MLIKIPFNKPNVAVGPIKACSGLKKKAVRGLPADTLFQNFHLPYCRS